MKIIKNPDGTETIEGTAEEIAEYTKKIRETQNEDKKPQRRLLTEAEIKEMIQEALKGVQKVENHHHYHYENWSPYVKPYPKWDEWIYGPQVTFGNVKMELVPNAEDIPGVNSFTYKLPSVT